MAHLALGMLGEGPMWDPNTRRTDAADKVLARHNLRPITLEAKEGLALINGTQLIASLGSEALVRAQRIARQADIVAALTLEVLRGTMKAFHPQIHQARVRMVGGRRHGRCLILLVVNLASSWSSHGR